MERSDDRVLSSSSECQFKSSDQAVRISESIHLMKSVSDSFLPYNKCREFLAASQAFDFTDDYSEELADIFRNKDKGLSVRDCGDGFQISNLTNPWAQCLDYVGELSTASQSNLESENESNLNTELSIDDVILVHKDVQVSGVVSCLEITENCVDICLATSNVKVKEALSNLMINDNTSDGKEKRKKCVLKTISKFFTKCFRKLSRQDKVYKLDEEHLMEWYD